MFKVYQYTTKHNYILLKFASGYFYKDKDIAEELNITLEEYQKIILRFGSYEADDGFLYFPTYQQCQNCCDYLTERFGVMLKLTE